jgi:hypothetical protein
MIEVTTLDVPNDDTTTCHTTTQRPRWAGLTPMPMLGLSQGFEQPLRSSLGTPIGVATLDELDDGAMMPHIINPL